MLPCETFDWLLWIRPIESLLGVDSLPSHASGKHAWVSWHRYQPPPLFIRSPLPTTSTSAVRARINTAGPISTYMTMPSPPPLITTLTLSPHLSHKEIQHALCLACSGISLCLCETFQAYPKHTHSHHVDIHCRTQCLHHSHKYYSQDHWRPFFFKK